MALGNDIITAYIDIDFSEDEEFSLDIVEEDSVDVDIDDTFLESERYTGSHIITPIFEDQTLATKHKLMTDNVIVLKIPVYEVHNLTGGMTVTVGGNNNISNEEN